MAGNSRPTFTKRSKECARQEKQAGEKAQKKAQRKLQKEEAPSERGGNPVVTYDADGQPMPLDFNDF